MHTLKNTDTDTNYQQDEKNKYLNNYKINKEQSCV